MYLTSGACFPKDTKAVLPRVFTVQPSIYSTLLVTGGVQVHINIRKSPTRFS
jgi:hypothetical protein